jgi:hypothetical protein
MVVLTFDGFIGEKGVFDADAHRELFFELVELGIVEILWPEVFAD